MKIFLKIWVFFSLMQIRKYKTLKIVKLVFSSAGSSFPVSFINRKNVIKALHINCNHFLYNQHFGSVFSTMSNNKKKC